MISRIKRLAVSSALILALGFTFTPLGCGGSVPAAGRGDAEVPEGVALRFRTCAVEHRTHIRPVEHSVRFDVTFAKGGQVDSVRLKTRRSATKTSKTAWRARSGLSPQTTFRCAAPTVVLEAL